jgi:hypothetical protein
MRNMLITPGKILFKNLKFSASMVELADTPVLGTGLARGTSSSLVRRTKEKTSERNTTRGKNCCTRCCIEGQMLHTVNGKLIVGLTSKTLVSLRKNRNITNPFTTAYYSSIATSFN